MRAVLLFFVLQALVWSSSSVDILKDYPAPFTANNRVLGMILSYNFDHIDPMMLILGEYQSMCEGGWNPTVVFFTTIHWSLQIQRLFRQRVFCYRTNSSVPIRVSVHDPSISTALGAQHRTYMQHETDNFDVFAYHEDDIIFKHSHLVAYLYETKHLHQLLPTNAKGLWENCIGFQRYRRLLKGGDVHGSHYSEQDLIEQELLEEMPNFRPLCIGDTPYLRVEGNIHQAIWVLTRSQVFLLQEKCSFLNQSSASRSAVPFSITVLILSFWLLFLVLQRIYEFVLAFQHQGRTLLSHQIITRSAANDVHHLPLLPAETRLVDACILSG